MIINKKLCPVGLKNNPNRLLKSIAFITIHCTSNYKPTATAKNHADYQYNGSGGASSSWHYSIDANEIWQSFEDNRQCWHCGDGNDGSGNSSSIGIELCVNDKNGFKKACDNAAWLTAELLKRHKLTIDKVVQHNNWTNKNCPAELRSGEWGVTWENFVGLVKQYLGQVTVGTPIMGKPTATINQMKKWAEAKKAAAFFIGLADTFYRLSVASGVNPVVAYCQSAKETKYGNFGGVLNASYNNPCGMKTKEGGGDYEPSAHQRFSCWEDGIQAQIDHLALYAGAVGYPKANTPDPRHFSFIAGKAPTVESLGGNWAPAESYGTDILRMMKEVEAVNAETKTETIRINITTPAENIDGHWMIRQADGKLVKVRDLLVGLGLSVIQLEESSKTIMATK